MKFLALEKEIAGVTSTDIQPHLRAEAQCVWELHKANIIREVYFTKERHEAVLILECDSVKEARKYLRTLPLVQHHLITFDLHTLEPYTGFERLFAGTNP